MHAKQNAFLSYNPFYGAFRISRQEFIISSPLSASYVVLRTAVLLLIALYFSAVAKNDPLLFCQRCHILNSILLLVSF